MSLDHGCLNVPLAKRGNIDAQIDRFKADQAAQQRARKAAHDVKVPQAKAMVQALSDERAAELMKRFGMTRKQLTTKLNSIAHWTPDVILKGI